jgi:hypothetical protein
MKRVRVVAYFSRPSPRVYVKFVTSLFFYSEGSLAPRPTPKKGNHPLLVVRGCLFNLFAATLHSWRPSLHPEPQDAPRRAVVTRDPPNTKVRKLHSEELHNLYSSTSIIIMVKSRMMRWAGHLARTGIRVMHIGYWW